jgi:uncharacterized radical SAM superfamily protein
MKQLSPETVWNMDEKELTRVLDRQQLSPRSRTIHFYAPSFMFYKTSHYCSSPVDFTTISVTASSCALKCKHCGGTVLDTMYPAVTPESLFELCSRLKDEGGLGCLISGGCLPKGSVPIEGFVDAIRRIKSQLGSTVFVHTGVVDFAVAEALKKAGVDAVLIDVIGSDDTIKEICNVDLTVECYADSLRALHETGLPFVPHVIVGLQYGRLKGEFNALKIISRYKPSALVIIAFMPIHGTEMEGVKPPEPIDIARVTAAARLMFPTTPLVLGCMRPKGKHRTDTDILAIKAGVDAVAFPSEEAIKFVEDKDYDTVFSSLCCSQIYVDLKV